MPSCAQIVIVCFFALVLLFCVRISFSLTVYSLLRKCCERDLHRVIYSYVVTTSQIYSKSSLQLRQISLGEREQTLNV